MIPQAKQAGEKKLYAYPAFYALLYQSLVAIGRDNGYAMTLHGSLARDMDVVAVPWTEEAIPPADLVALIIDDMGALTLEDFGHPPDPREHPHGRLVWTLLLGGNAFIDLGVMPLTDSKGT